MKEASLFVKNVDELNQLKDPGVKYSQFILLIKSLVDDIKMSNRPILALIKEYKKVIEIVLTIKNFIFDPSYKPAVSLITNKVISTPEKVEEVEEMIKTAKTLEDNKVAILTDTGGTITDTLYTKTVSREMLPSLNQKQSNKKFKKN